MYFCCGKAIVQCHNFININIMDMKIFQISFRANNKDYEFFLNEPIIADSHEVFREKAKKAVEEYMFDNRIPGPYRLYLL